MMTYKNNNSLSICVPVYNGSLTLQRALDSIFRQNYQGKYDVVILDDNNSQNIREIQKTREIINQFNNKKIKYYKNEKNLGSALTIKNLAGLAKGDILTFLCQDDIFSRDALAKIVNSFRNPEVGVLTRPFFWFEDDFRKPIRAVSAYNSKHDTVVSILDNDEAVRKIFGSVGQISGLAYRKKYLTRDFTGDIFPGHIYPFAEILKKHKCMFLKDHIVAVGLKTSQTRFNSKIYSSSPLEAWVKMFATVYGSSSKYKNVRDVGVINIATHYEGLVQIKNYGSYRALIREIFLHLKFYPRSKYSPKFWFYILLTVFIPRRILIYASDYYKRNVLAKKLNELTFNFL